MERLINSAWHVQRPRRDVVATAAPLARGRAGSRRFFRESADNVRLDPQGKLAYVGYGDGALAVVDPQQMRLHARRAWYQEGPSKGPLS